MPALRQPEESIWGKQPEHITTRRIVPDAKNDTQDTTDYLRFDPLCPGVRLSSAMKTSSDPEHSLPSRSSTAGVLLQNNLGHQRMTAALHSFSKSDEVFHPGHTGVRIGKIDEKWDGLDIALTRLDPSVLFFNEEYFDVNPPKRLLYSSQAHRGDWYEAHGMTTGAVFFQLRGERFMCPEPRDRSGLYSPCPGSKRPDCQRLDRVQIIYRELFEESIMYVHAPSGVYALPGLCGAPIVSADPAIAGVVGFFRLQLEDKKTCFCAVLNELIDSGWELAKKPLSKLVVSAALDDAASDDAASDDADSGAPDKSSDTKAANPASVGQASIERSSTIIPVQPENESKDQKQLVSLSQPAN